MSAEFFPAHTVDSAPARARPTIECVAQSFGFIPQPVAMMATSPELLAGFLQASATFEQTSLSPVEREVLILTVAARTGCHVCVAMHSGILCRHKGSPELIEGLRAGKPLEDPRLDALRIFTHAVMDASGAVEPAAMNAFLAQGFTARNALEVVLGVGTYVISTFANRMTEAPLDDAFAAFAWESPAP